MKKYFSISAILLLNFQFLSAQKEVPKNQYEEFLEDIKSQILNDTSKFKRENLFHNSIGTHNKESYSKLYLINGKYAYKLDVICRNLVEEFINEFLILKRVKARYVLDEPSSKAIFGVYGRNGLISIKFKRRFNPKVAGLKLTKNGGNNFNQRKPDELLIEGTK